jgi:hypothetical protein
MKVSSRSNARAYGRLEYFHTLTKKANKKNFVRAVRRIQKQELGSHV